jgi:anti-anti-sigma regulatory factor
MSRETGVVDAVAGLYRGDHVCWSYSSADEHAGVLQAFFSLGLQADERLFYFGYDGTADRVLAGLRRGGNDPDELMRAGRLIMGDALEAYLPDGTFDAAERIDGFRALAREAVAAGFSGIRVAAENACVLNHPQLRDQWYEYEVQVELLTATEPILGMCSFDRNICSADALELLDAVHRVHLDPEGCAPRSPFHLHGRSDGRLALSGEVDAFTAQHLIRLIDGPAMHSAHMTIDVTRLDFIDAAGIRALETAALDRPLGSAPLMLQGATPQLRRIWSLACDPSAPISLTPA